MYPPQMDEYPHDGVLILEEKAKTLDTAWKIPILLLRWKCRVCQGCDKKFNIAKEGKFYKCGGCVN